MSASHIKAFISSLSSSSKGSNEYILKKIVKLFMQDTQQTYKQHFIMGQINSKDIEKLLTLLENKDRKIRKLTLLVLCYLLKNGKSKVYFLEKCGLGLKIGKIFLSRLKYLTLNIKEAEMSINILNKISEKSRGDLNKDDLFWYVPLITLDKKAIDISQVSFYHFFETSIELDSLEEIETENLPDPIYNLCGFDLTLADIQNSSMTPNNMENSKILDSSLVTEESLIVSSRPDINGSIKAHIPGTSVKRDVKKSKVDKSDKNDDNKSNKSNDNISQYSALKKSHIFPFKSRDKVDNKKFAGMITKSIVTPKTDRPSSRHNIDSKYGTNKRASKLTRTSGYFCY